MDPGSRHRVGTNVPNPPTRSKMETLTVEQLHDLYFGAQDKYNAATFVKANFHAESVVATETQEVRGRRLVYCPAATGHGISNIRIGGDWISAELEVGGQRFCKIYPFMGLDGFWYTDGGRALPALAYHDIRVVVYAGEAGAKVTWDVVKLDTPLLDVGDTIYALGHQYTGRETVTKDQSNIRLNFNHPVFALYVKTDKQVKWFRLQLNGDWADVPFVWNETAQRWEAVFQEIPEDGVPLSSEKTVNFSRVDRATLHVEHDCESVEVDVWVVTAQITRFMHGMAGLAFSK